AAVGVGLLPRAAAGLGLAGEVLLTPWLAARAGAVLFPEVRTPAPDPNFAFGLTLGWVGACFDAVRRESLSVGACAALSAGLTHAVVYYPDATAPGQRMVWAGSGGLRLAVRLAARVEAQVV